LDDAERQVAFQTGATPLLRTTGLIRDDYFARPASELTPRERGELKDEEFEPRTLRSAESR